MSEPFPEIHGVILIDCWPSSDFVPLTDNFYLNVMSVIDQHPITQVVAACYSTDTYTPGALSPILRNSLKTKCTITDITNPIDFIKHNQEWQIQNWLVAGLSWGICLHTRPMGFENMSRYAKDLEFYIDRRGIQTQGRDLLSENDVKVDSLMWQTVSTTGYRLVK
jgi:hypothetical protein